jgi:hypothetical protein
MTLPPIRTIGLVWFREEDYPTAKSIFEDGSKMPGTWEDWHDGAKKMEKRAQAQGCIVERVYIDPDTFPAWCMSEGVGVNSDGRHRFVAVTLAAKYSNQS